MQNTDNKKNFIVIYVSNTSLSIKQLVSKYFINELKKKYNIIILSTFNFPDFYTKKNKDIIFCTIPTSNLDKIVKKNFFRILIFFMQFLYNNSYKNRTLSDFNEIFLNEKLKYKNKLFSVIFKLCWKTSLKLFGTFYFLRNLLIFFLRYNYNSKIELIDVLIKKYNPKILITSSPGLLNYDLQIINIFKSYKIKTASLLLSWDHASGLGYISSRMDLYLVWGKNSFNDLMKFSDVKKDNIKIIGPLHWVFHFEKKYEMKKKLFFEKNNLNLNKKTVLISLKSPTRTKINEIMRFLNHLLKENLLKDVQFIINPHPINFSEKFKSDLIELKDFCNKYKQFHLTKNFYNQEIKHNSNISDKNGDINTQLEYLDEENSYNVNLLEHSDLMINFFSTLNIEAGIHGLSSINYIYNKTNDYIMDDSRKNLHIDYNQVHNYRLVKSGGTNVCFDYVSLIDLTVNLLFKSNIKNKVFFNKMVYNEISPETVNSHILAVKYIDETLK